MELDEQPRVAAPKLSDDLTEWTSEGISGLLVDFTNWSSYASGQLALAAIDEKEAEANLAMAQARAAVAAKGEKSVAAQKAAAADDPDVREATACVLDTYALRKVLEAKYSELDSKAKVTSREITRRTGTRDIENRSGKWGT